MAIVAELSLIGPAGFDILRAVMGKWATDFSPSVIKQARELAAFKCCYCRERMGDEIHHLKPKENGGLAELDNAILLCAQCHTDYGHRADKASQLRQARDHWYELVKARYGPANVEQIGRLQDLATKQDTERIMDSLGQLYALLMTSVNNGTTSSSQAANVASTMISSITGSVAIQASASVMATAVVTRKCVRCGRPFEPIGADANCCDCQDEFRSA